MEGGAFLKAGTYGCVFDPPLRCLARPGLKIQPNKVGKLALARDVLSELNAAKILSSVKNSTEYFSLMDTTSLCKYENIEKDAEEVKEMDICKIKCETIRDNGTSQMIHYVMPFGGMSIQKYFDNPAKPKEEKRNPRAIIIRILEAAATMALNNLIHYDLHPGNILFDKKTGLPRIIDFGLSFSADSIDQELLDSGWKGYDPVHPLEQPEITIITGMHKKGLSFTTAFNEVLNNKLSLKDAQTILGLSRVQQGKTFNAFWNNSQTALKKDWVGFFRFYWPVFDAWGVGIIILDIFVEFSKNPLYSNDPEWRTTTSQIKELLRGLMQMSPQRRIDCVEALAMYDPENDVLLSLSGKAWLASREKLRAAV
jgi:serine/threonine protein kinase